MMHASEVIKDAIAALVIYSTVRWPVGAPVKVCIALPTKGRYGDASPPVKSIVRWTDSRVTDFLKG